MKQNSITKDEDLTSSPTCGKPLVMGSTVSIREIEGINRVHHLNFLDNTLPDKCANLIIADPPYFEVKGEFDFIWKDFKSYLEDVYKWAVECKRLLSDNGTLFWFGDAKKIAYSQVIIDEHFELVNNIAIEFNRQTKKGVEEFRCFAPVSERLLMYETKDNYHDIVREAIEEVQTYLNTLITRNELAEKLLANGNCKNYASAKQNANNILSQKSAKPQLITRLQYELIECEKIDYSELVLMYEYKREQVNIKRRHFDNYLKLYDIMKFDQEAHITKNYEHDTCKPETLSRALIMTCSRQNDLVIVPFAGSGTEVAMSVKEGRRAIGFDIESKYVEMSNKRVLEILRKPELFR